MSPAGFLSIRNQNFHNTSALSTIMNNFFFVYIHLTEIDVVTASELPSVSRITSFDSGTRYPGYKFWNAWIAWYIAGITSERSMNLNTMHPRNQNLMERNLKKQPIAESTAQLTLWGFSVSFLTHWAVSGKWICLIYIHQPDKNSMYLFYKRNIKRAWRIDRDCKRHLRARFSS